MQYKLKFESLVVSTGLSINSFRQDITARIALAITIILRSCNAPAGNLGSITVNRALLRNSIGHFAREHRLTVVLHCRRIAVIISSTVFRSLTVIHMFADLDGSLMIRDRPGYKLAYGSI